MREIRLPFGKAANGVMVTVDQVDRGLDCECICPSCEQKLVACKGEVVRAYFRHYADPLVCIDARETALHLYAKQLIVRSKRLTLPDEIGEIKTAMPEMQLSSGVRPDVLLEYMSGETVAVEIFVEHRVPQEKIEIYSNTNQAALEIDLGDYRHVDQADWDVLILGHATRYWLYPPQSVRAEREALRQKQIDLLRVKREQALKEWREAELAKTHQEKLREEAKDAAEREAATIAVDRAIALMKERIAFAEYRQDVVKEAEQRNKTAERRRALLEQRDRERQPPNLQALVAAHGSYPAITSEAWEQWDRDVALHRERVRTGYFYIDPTQLVHEDHQVAQG